MNLEQDGLTQPMMSLLTGVTSTTISRAVSAQGCVPLPLPNKRNLRYSIEGSQQVIASVCKKHGIKKKVHAFYNFKGGTGKTSICYQVGCHLALLGYKVLLVDVDPQAHLTVSVGVKEFVGCTTLYDCIVRGVSVHDVIRNVYKGLDIVPSNISLTRLEPEINNIARREERLALALEPVANNYDFILIDANPTISVLNRNVVTFSDCLEIVAETHPLSLSGLKFLIEDLNKFYGQMQIAPRATNIIPNKYEDRSSNAAEAMAALKKYYSQFLKADFAIRRSEEIVTSSKISKPLAFFVKKNSIALEDIVELCHHIIEISSDNITNK